MAQDFDMKMMVDPTAIASLFQRKAMAEQEAKRQRQQDNLRLVTDSFQMASQAVSGLVQQSKEKQKQDFVKAMSDAYRPAGVPMDVPLSPEQEQQRQMVGNAMQVNPEFATQQVIRKAFPDPTSIAKNSNNFMSVTNRKTGESKMVVANRDSGSMTNLDGTPVPAEEAMLYERQFAPQMVQTPNGPIMVPKMAGNINTAQPMADPKQGKSRIEEFTQPEVERIDLTRAELQRDNVFKVAQTRISDLEQAEANLDTENWVGDATINSLLAKGLGKDAGALSEYDQKRYEASPEVVRRIQTKVSRWVKGTVTSADRDDIREALRISRLKAEDIADRRVDLYVRKAVRGASKANKEFLRAYMYGENETNAASGAIDLGDGWSAEEVDE